MARVSDRELAEAALESGHVLKAPAEAFPNWEENQERDSPVPTVRHKQWMKAKEKNRKLCLFENNFSVKKRVVFVYKTTAHRSTQVLKAHLENLHTGEI